MHEDHPRAPRHEDHRGRSFHDDTARYSTYEERVHGLWPELRSWPKRVQIGAAALAAAMIASAFVLPAVLGGVAGSDESEWPSGTVPAAGEPVDDESDQPAIEEEELPTGVEPYDGEPLWTEAVEEEGDEIVQLDDGSMLRTDGALRRLDEDGGTVWEHTWDDFSPSISVGDEVAVIASDHGDFDDEDYEWPGRVETLALDLETGDEVWNDTDASFATPFADAVYMTECTGDQEDNIGDCTLYERDPADNSTRWSTPTYASAQVLGGSSWAGEDAPDRLRVESFPTGYDSRTVTVYEGAGSELVSVPTHDSVSVVDDTLLVYDDYDDNPADECTAQIAAYRFGGGGDPAWEVEADTRKSEDLSSCGELPSFAVVDGKLPLTIDGEPGLVDIATGETDWTAPAEGQAYAADGDTFILVDWEAEEDNVTAYDIESGDERWRATTAVGAATQASMNGGTLWIYGSFDMWGGWSTSSVFGYDLANGDGLALPGSMDYFAPGQIITVTGDYDDQTYQAWPIDLFE